MQKVPPPQKFFLMLCYTVKISGSLRSLHFSSSMAMIFNTGSWSKNLACSGHAFTQAQQRIQPCATRVASFSLMTCAGHWLAQSMHWVHASDVFGRMSTTGGRSLYGWLPGTATGPAWPERMAWAVCRANSPASCISRLSGLSVPMAGVRLCSAIKAEAATTTQLCFCSVSTASRRASS